MAPQQMMQFVSKTQHYLKVKKPMIERQRRARINKCLDSLKELVAELQGNDAILRMDKAEMLESALTFVKTQTLSKKSVQTPAAPQIPMDSFRNGYMNAVNEVSRVMAATPGMNVNVGKSVMSHLGCEYNRLLTIQSNVVQCSYAPMSPASSGYHSDDCEDSCSLPSMPSSPAQKQNVWRPW